MRLAFQTRQRNERSNHTHLTVKVSKLLVKGILTSRNGKGVRRTRASQGERERERLDSEPTSISLSMPVSLLVDNFLDYVPNDERPISRLRLYGRPLAGLRIR